MNRFNKMINDLRKQYDLNIVNYSNYEKTSQVNFEMQYLFNLSIKAFFAELQNKVYDYKQFKNWLERHLPFVSTSYLIWGVLYYFWIEMYFNKNIENFIDLVKSYFPQEKISDSEYLKQNILKIVKILRESKDANIQLYVDLYQKNRNLQSLLIVKNKLQSDGIDII